MILTIHLNKTQNNKPTLVAKIFLCASVVFVTSFCLTDTMALADNGDWDKLIDSGQKAYQQKNYAEAEHNFADAAAKAEASGANDTLGLSLNDLALALEAQGKLADAEQMYKRAIAAKEKSAGLDSPTLVPTLNNLALLYRGQHKYDGDTPQPPDG